MNIKMVVYNFETRKMEEVFPEDEVAIGTMVPLFWSEETKSYYSIPNVSAASVYEEWIEGLNS